MAGLRPWVGPDAQWILADPEACSKLAAAILQRVEAEESSFQARRLQSWRSWVAGATKPGSSAGHRWTKGANGWASDAMADQGVGLRPLGLQERAEWLLDEWLKGPWSCEDRLLQEEDWGPLPGLPPLTGQQLRSASKSFPWKTGVAML